MNRSRLILMLVFFLAGSLDLWAQKPNCYHSIDDSNMHDTYVLILPIPGTNGSKTIRFSELRYPLSFAPPDIAVVTVFPDVSAKQEGYPATLGLIIDV